METKNIITLETARTIALKTAKDILVESNILPKDPLYATRQYELQYGIYHAIKKALKLKSE